MNNRAHLMARKLVAPAALVVIFWGLMLALWRSAALIGAGLVVGYLVVALGAGLAIYLTLPRARRPLGRRIVFVLIGSSLFGICIWTQRNVQIEGLFFGILTGVLEGAVLHYLIGKIGGPLLFGRIWCGWACWIGMSLDMLPYRHGGGWLPGGWRRLRYAHFGLSLAIVLLAWGILRYRGGAIGADAVIWFLIGNALYYLVAITLAFALRDNRAFCKYLCPVTVPLRLSSRFALLKVRRDPERCNHHEECVKICPMDIRITDYGANGERVLASECILCQECINICPENALKLTIELDRGGNDLLMPHGQ